MSDMMKNEIYNLTDLILKDCERGRIVDKTNQYNDLDKDIVIDIIYKLQRIIFPGYFRNQYYRTYTIENNLSMMIEDVVYNLTKQIAKSLKYVKSMYSPNVEENQEEAERICLKFMHQIPKIRDLMESDVKAAFDGDPAAFNTDEIIYSYPGLFAIMIQRVAHELHTLCIPLIPRMMTEHAHSLTGIDIHPGASIGRSFFIDHGTGIVIGETTEIGDNVKIYQGVTLGALSTKAGQGLRSKKRHPTIENNVTIYSGASILGGETVIGENVVVGGNVFITSSVPANARVSVKSQELVFNYGGKQKSEAIEFNNDDNWSHWVI